MTLIILGIVSGIIPLLVWWIKRVAERRDDPISEHRKRYATIDQDIIKGASERASINSGNDLDELERLQRSKGNLSGSGGNKPEGG